MFHRFGVYDSREPNGQKQVFLGPCRPTKSTAEMSFGNAAARGTEKLCTPISRLVVLPTFYGRPPLLSRRSKIVIQRHASLCKRGWYRELHSTLHWPRLNKVECFKAKVVGLPLLVATRAPWFGHFGSYLALVLATSSAGHGEAVSK